jgi:two-component system sensor histidine kinase HydH
MQMRSRFFFVSPWLLAAATALLVLIVVTFTLSNIKREKELMTNAMLQKGVTLMRVVGSGARSAHMVDLRRGVWNTRPWEEYVQRIINHLSEDSAIRFLMVVDDQNRIVAHSDQKKVNSLLTDLPKFSTFTGTGRAKIAYQVESFADYGRTFVVVRPFLPFRPPIPSLLHAPACDLDEADRPLAKKPADRKRFFDKNHRFHQPFLSGKHFYYAVVALDMQEYDKSIQRLRFQALMLSLTMLLVGIGGWLSLVAVQGYRVSQKALTDIQAFTGLLVSRLPVGIIATDQQGRISTWNQAATDMLSVAGSQCLGRPVLKKLPEELVRFFVLENKNQDRFADSREVRLVINGQDCVFLCQLIELRDAAEQYMGQVLLLSDVTRIKDMEVEMRENERLAAVGRMAAGVAHEVRNPLSSIKGLALLLKNKFARESREFETTGLLIQEVERMNRTISELLSFARPAALDLQPVNLQELLRETLQLVAADTVSEHIQTRLDIGDDLPLVMVDRDRLSQVFINILLNGVQAMRMAELWILLPGWLLLTASLSCSFGIQERG